MNKIITVIMLTVSAGIASANNEIDMANEAFSLLSLQPPISLGSNLNVTFYAPNEFCDILTVRRKRWNQRYIVSEACHKNMNRIKFNTYPYLALPNNSEAPVSANYPIGSSAFSIDMTRSYSGSRGWAYLDGQVTRSQGGSTVIRGDFQTEMFSGATSADLNYGYTSFQLGLKDGGDIDTVAYVDDLGRALHLVVDKNYKNRVQYHACANAGFILVNETEQPLNFSRCSFLHTCSANGRSAESENIAAMFGTAGFVPNDRSDSYVSSEHRVSFNLPAKSVQCLDVYTTGAEDGQTAYSLWALFEKQGDAAPLAEVRLRLQGFTWENSRQAFMYRNSDLNNLSQKFSIIAAARSGFPHSKHSRVIRFVKNK